MKFRSVLYIIIAIASLGISIPFAIWYGAIGCAVGTTSALVAGQIIVMNIYYYKKQSIDIPRFWLEIGKMSIVPILFVVTSLFAISYFHIHLNSYSHLLLWGTVYSALYLPSFWWLSMNTSERDLFKKPFRRFIKK